MNLWKVRGKICDNHLLKINNRRKLNKWLKIKIIKILYRVKQKITKVIVVPNNNNISTKHKYTHHRMIKFIIIIRILNNKISHNPNRIWELRHHNNSNIQLLIAITVSIEPTRMQTVLPLILSNMWQLLLQQMKNLRMIQQSFMMNMQMWIKLSQILRLEMVR